MLDELLVLHNLQIQFKLGILAKTILHICVRLEVTLGKKEPGTTWPSLLEGVEEENGGVRRLPLTEGLTSGELHREEMETIERKIVEASKRERVRYMLQKQQ